LEANTCRANEPTPGRFQIGTNIFRRLRKL
jgi:hypothetical protein